MKSDSRTIIKDPAGGMHVRCNQCGDDIMNGCVCKTNDMVRDQMWDDRFNGVD